MSRADVVAVIVTYNRPELLLRCLSAVNKQDYPVQRIIIIDNASDISVESLKPTADVPIAVIRTPENIGGAGGFHLGLKRAMKSHPHSVWMMDDDGAPDPGCLRQLCYELEKGLQIANPLVLDEQDEEALAFGFRVKASSVKTRKQAEAEATEGVIRGVANPFNGTLISRDAYNRLGDVKAECFIWGDETEYLQRARTVGLEIGTAVNAIHRHPKMRSSLVSVFPFGTIKKCPENRSHHFYRNFGFRLYKYDKPRFLFKLVVYSLFLPFLFSRHEAKKFWNYYWDGALDRYSLHPSRQSLARQLELTELRYL